MQIIVVKDPSYMRRRAPSLALCEVVRRTGKRFYVRLIRGDNYALDGFYTKEPYVSADAVLSFDPSQFDAMVAATKAYEAKVAELDKLEDEAWQAMAAVLKPTAEQ